MITRAALLSGVALLLAVLLLGAWAHDRQPPGEAEFMLVSDDSQLEVQSVQRIWSQARHNGFPDLLRYKDELWCVLREGEAHVGGDRGRIRVLSSRDGEQWASAAFISDSQRDLRDVSISVTPGGKLMLLVVTYDGVGTTDWKKRDTRVSFSENGRDWSPLKPILAPGDRLWRVTWHQGLAYGVSATYRNDVRYSTLYRSGDGLEWQPVSDVRFSAHGMDADSASFSETRLGFLEDGTLMAMIRPGYIGRSRPPYKEWDVHRASLKMYGPNWIEMQDHSVWMTTRYFRTPKTVAEQQRVEQGKQGVPSTLLACMDASGALIPQLVLPSGGDTGYAGLTRDGDTLWVAYYSSHGGTSPQLRWSAPRLGIRWPYISRKGTSVYMAKLKSLSSGNQRCA